MNTRALVVFVHGDTGHQCCCNDCAKDLKNSNQPCPICMSQIDLVVRSFLS